MRARNSGVKAESHQWVSSDKYAIRDEDQPNAIRVSGVEKVGWTSNALSLDRAAHLLISAALFVVGNPVIAGLRCSRMSAFVDFQKLGFFDGRIGLGRGKRRVPQQYLDRAEIAAGLQQMGGERMPERVRRGGSRKPQADSRLFHCLPDRSLVQRSSSCSNEQRRIRLVSDRAQFGISSYRVASDRKDRHDSFLVSFAANLDGFRERMVAPCK